jgi:hypothetical protein
MRMTAQQKRETPESAGKAKPRPEMSGRDKPKPEIAGKDKPGTMPENPANVDREHEPAGIDPGTDRTKER